MNTILSDLKLILGISDNTQDNLLNSILNRVTEEAKEFTRNDDIDELIPSTIVQMAVIHFNKLKSEGVSSENYGGLSYNYLVDYPENILRVLKRNRKLGVVRSDS